MPRNPKKKMDGVGRNYKYGAYAPLTNEDEVRWQMVLGHRYRNRLVEVELDIRAKRDAIIQEVAPGLLALEDEINKMGEIIALHEKAQKEQNKKQRGRDVHPGVANLLRDLKAEKKGLVGKRKALKAELFASDRWKQDGGDHLNQQRKEGRSNAYSEYKDEGLWWGVRSKILRESGSFISGAPPKFRGWHKSVRSTRFVVQTQGGLTEEELLSGRNTTARLTLFPDGVWAEGKRRPKRMGDAILDLRIGSDEHRKPIWTSIPISYDRHLPAEAKIKWIYLFKRLLVDKEKWEVVFALECPAAADYDAIRRRGGDKKRTNRNRKGIRLRKYAQSGVVAIDVGWRKFEDYLLVGTCAASDGREWELRLDGNWLGQLRRVEGMQSYRDVLLNEQVKWLHPWLKSRKGSLPELLLPPSRNLEKWGQRSVARLVKQWMRERPIGTLDEQRALARLDEWLSRENHVWHFQANLQHQLLLYRREEYRVWARRIGEVYRCVVLEKLNYGDWHKKPPVERGGSVKADMAKKYLRDAGLSHLKNALKGGVLQVADVPHEGTTVNCHACGHADVWEDPAAKDHVCETCGLRWDRDVNAARNILAASGVTVAWEREPLAPTEAWTACSKSGLNRAQRRAISSSLAIDSEIALAVGGSE